MLKTLLLEKKEKMAVIGLGYVGMPLAVEFSKYFMVIGYDTNKEKINSYKKGIDITNEIGNDVIKNSTINFTSNEDELEDIKFYVVAVPTPIKDDKSPDLKPVIEASKVVGRHISKNSIIVYESTVYPGVTEDVCLPILEKESGLEKEKDFLIGYSPERINPGDKIHKLTNIKKIVSGINEYAKSEISDIYSTIIEAGVYPVSSIKVAEASKVCENSQRDINIAFVNELAMAFGKMNIDTNEVIDAMDTKWNALKFRPGLVGGHCIGVDPYYFLYETEQLGYHSQIVSSSRKVNEGMVDYVVSAILKQMILADIKVKNAIVAFLGVTFKENCSDIRNSKAIEIIKKLEEYGINIIVTDCHASIHEVKKENNIDLININEIQKCQCVIFAVAHNEYRNLTNEQIENLFDLDVKERVIIDIKGMYRKRVFNQISRYWSL